MDTHLSACSCICMRANPPVLEEKLQSRCRFRLLAAPLREGTCRVTATVASFDVISSPSSSSEYLLPAPCHTLPALCQWLVLTAHAQELSCLTLLWSRPLLFLVLIHVIDRPVVTSAVMPSGMRTQQPTALSVFTQGLDSQAFFILAENNLTKGLHVFWQRNIIKSSPPLPPPLLSSIELAFTPRRRAPQTHQPADYG
jgi:hypothetical protein